MQQDIQNKKISRVLEFEKNNTLNYHILENKKTTILTTIKIVNIYSKGFYNILILQKVII